MHRTVKHNEAGKQQLLLIVACVLLSTATADSTAESLLDCSPLRVEPNQNILCTVFVRDSLQEPTTKFAITDYYISPVASISGTVLTTSSPIVGSDPTTLVFTISAATGTNIAVNVYLRSTGETIRGSGVTAAVLVWPATRIGDITCSTQSFVNGALPLRAWTVCSGDVSGNNGLPAVVRPTDVYFTEDHFAGSFAFVSGSMKLVFNFSAPATISAPFDNFRLRVTLSSSDALYSVSLPMTYPSLPPTRVSLLQCSGAIKTICFLNAQDTLGPVLFQAPSFVVVFEKLDDVSSAWVSSTSGMNLTLTAGTAKNTEQLSWTVLKNTEISTQRVRVYLAPLSSTGTGIEVSGSPYVFTAGTAPTPGDVSLRGCSLLYVPAGNSTLCTIDLMNGVSGDARYYSVGSTIGASISPLSYVDKDPKYGTPALQFVYTAPTSVGIRVEDALSVTVAGAPVQNSPARLIVYPITVVVAPTETASKIPGMIAVGLVFYGACLSVGGGLFFRRQRRMRSVQLARAAREREEMKKASLGLTEEHHRLTTAHGHVSGAASAVSQSISYDGTETLGLGLQPRHQAASTTPRTPHSSTTGESPKSIGGG